ncbi:Hypothetical protein R9X50_00013900 [Acrodontium crateriforme]|uniref:Zn(2)-C6 fungal-type domain-containing protein n=1 Tax=Acrodontium crateriforme TaxID=150365 RepID=A0AAQ3LY98_9PEZI|nr:Hypothetical protein R9X50_00013900 [Acrodontium crateriforme]
MTSTIDNDQLSALQASAAPLAANREHLKQKRARSQLSCTPCRQGKLKCNRAHEPACDQCIKRNRESACVFPPPPAKNNKPPQNVKGRIRQLENLVVDLMNQNRNAQKESVAEGGSNTNGSHTLKTKPSSSGSPGTFSHPTPSSDADKSPRSSVQSRQDGESPRDDADATAPLFGRMKISKNEISYVGESHWNAILNSISDLKRDLGDQQDEDETDDVQPQEITEATTETWTHILPGMGQPLGVPGLGFMLGHSTSATREQLITSVPEKKIADRLLSLWFNSPDPFKPIIHGPTFQDEYRRFWRDPTRTPVMWLGLLYSILSLAASFALRDTDPTSAQAKKIVADVNKYHSLAASAAVAADFTKPKPYTIECLILYGAGLRSNNAFLNIWLMIGLVVRLALRMGYHRDPSHYPNISPFQGEMRRRIWAVISMIDVLISFQLGLPSMVKTIQTDTLPPRNLLDRDFNPSSKLLPPDRNVDELTPSSYTRAKLQTVRVFADAADLSHATIPPPYEEMMALDRQLEDARSNVPPMLQMPEISELVTDPAEQLMCRFNLALLYRKTKIVLHRRYMLTPLSQLSPREQQRGVGDSRKICIESALQVLEYHHTIYAASQSGGQLESVKWYMGSISTHDFLLAAMVLCLELSSQINNAESQVSPSGLACPRRGAMMAALEKSQKIWSDASTAREAAIREQRATNPKYRADDMFDETDKAARAMSAMLKRVKRQFGAQEQPVLPKDDFNPPTPMTQFLNELDRDSARTIESSGPSTASPFEGLNSSYQWNDLGGVPDAMDLGDTRVNEQSTETNGATRKWNDFGRGVLPEKPLLNGNITSNGDINMDFPMIGNMLDVNADLDWQSWDNQFATGLQEQTANDWSPQIDSDVSNPGDIRFFGNSLLGGTGPIAPQNASSQRPSMLLGNAFNGGTGPLPPSQTMTGTRSPPLNFSHDSLGYAGNNGAYSNVDFSNIDADMLQDVRFGTTGPIHQLEVFTHTG